MKTTRRKGRFYRVCDPAWVNCADGSFSARFGGRWNPPESFPVLYLNADVATARANAVRRYEGEAFTLFDLNPTARPHLQAFDVAPCAVLDVVSPEGIRDLALPSDYPNGVTHERCQAIGAHAREKGLAGVACRSAARDEGEELALFEISSATKGERQTFDQWFGLATDDNANTPAQNS